MADLFGEWQERNLESLAKVDAEAGRRAAWYASRHATVDEVQELLDRFGLPRTQGDEELTVKERLLWLADIIEGLSAVARGETRPFSEIRKELGR